MNTITREEEDAAWAEVDRAVAELAGVNVDAIPYVNHRARVRLAKYALAEAQRLRGVAKHGPIYESSSRA